MGAREIPRDEWIRFCDDYSRQHEGWLASLEVKGREVGDRLEARSMPFHGISYETKGTGKDDMAIFLDRGTEASETHTISHPKHLFLNRDGKTDKGLEVEAADGTKTILRFDSPTSPDMVDRM